LPRRTVPAAKAPSITQEDGVTVITLGSEYESLQETELETLKGTLLETAERADPPLIVLDLSNLRYFGSALIESLFRTWNHLKSRPGGRLALCGLTSYCREVVEITHLDQLWSIFETRDQAVRSMKTA
jgi:anti-sigma B factor antagonist